MLRKGEEKATHCRNSAAGACFLREKNHDELQSSVYCQVKIRFQLRGKINDNFFNKKAVSHVSRQQICVLSHGTLPRR